MKRLSTYPIVASLVLVSLAISLVPIASSAQSSAKTDLDINYTPRGLEVVEAKLQNKTINQDGTISADLLLDSKTALTYGLAVSVEGGTVSGPKLDHFLLVHDVAIPIVGMRTLPLQRITFSPGATLKMHFNKTGFYAGDGGMLLALDFITAFELFTGVGYLPTKPAELLPAVSDGVLQLLNNIGFDLADFTLQLQREDWLGAGATLGRAFARAPKLFTDFLSSEWGLTVAPEAFAQFGEVLNKGLPVVGALPVVFDLIRKPADVQVTIHAVGQAVGTNTDVVLVIDRSGSMDGHKLQDAQSSARLFVDLMHTGDKIGIVSFSDVVRTDFQLTTVSDSVKQDAKRRIDGLIAGGNTTIGGGLQAAEQELSVRSDPTHTHAIVLLSDGLENTPPMVSDVLASVVAAHTLVFTIGLGSDADQALLQKIAQQTGGSFQFAPTSDQLASIYNLLAGRVAGQQVVSTGQGTAAPGQTDLKSAPIGSREATFSITWPNSAGALELRLVSPAGRVIDPAAAAADPAIEYASSPGYAFYRITSPETGVWQLRTTNPAVAQNTMQGTLAAITYEFAVSVLSDLKLQAAASADTVLPGETFTLSGVLFDNNGVIVGAQVMATDQQTGTTLSLADDGMHGDGVADDGTYAAFYSSTTSGAHALLVQASGRGFERQELVTVRVSDQASPNADLWIAHGGPAEAEAGTVVTYVGAYGNNGPNGAGNAIIEEYLPAGTSFVSSTLGAPSSVSGQTLAWSTSNVEPQNVSSWSIAVRFPVGAIQGVPITNRVDIKAKSPLVDPNVINNRSVMTTTIAGANLQLSKRVEPAVVASGDAMTYTLRYSNTQSVGAHNVILTDTLPVGLTYVGSSANCNEDFPGTVVCNLGVVPGNSFGSFIINAAVDITDSQYALFTNTARIGTGTLESDYTDNEATATNALKFTNRRGTIEGYVYLDLNQNGWRDENEPGIPGVDLYLNTGAGTHSYVLGWYGFTSLDPGTYTVRVQVPVGYVNTSPRQLTVTLASEQDMWGPDFGLKVAPTSTPTATSTPTPTRTRTPIPTPTATPTATRTPTATATTTPTATYMPTSTPTTPSTATPTQAIPFRVYLPIAR